MKSIFPVSILLILLSTLFVNAQIGAAADADYPSSASPPCSHDEVRTKLAEEDPDFLAKEKEYRTEMLLQINDEIEKRKKQRGFKTGDTIPVVFHILYGCGDPEDFISTQRILDGLQKVNEDFQGLTACDDPCDPGCDVSYPDLLGCAPGIHFQLADKDTLGNPTTGINRVKTDITSLGIGGSKDLRRFLMWPRERYLNVYVLADATSAGNSGIAFYPTDAHYTNEANADDRFYDGVVVAEWALSPVLEKRQNYSYILSHEIGHWLGLRHLWGGNSKLSGCSRDDFDFLTDFQNEFGSDYPNISDFDDKFNDTPESRKHDIKAECSSYEGSECESGEAVMYDNFMDYSGCAAMFTEGQMDFMDLVLTSSIADRNILISNETSDLVFKQDDDEKRVVFTDNLFYEAEANNGTVNGTVEIKLENTDFEDDKVGTVLSSSYYTIENLPNGITETVEILDNTTAELTLSGTTTYNEDIEIEFSFTNSPNLFSEPAILLANRTKQLRIEFIEREGIQYTDVAPDASVGPNSERLAKVRAGVKDLRKSLPLEYIEDKFQFEGNKFITVFLEPGTNTVKVFAKGDQINDTAYDYEVIDDSSGEYYDLNVPQGNLDNDEFYVGIVMGDCYKHYGWLRLLRDKTCSDQITIKDCGINIIPGDPIDAGKLTYPVLARESNIIGANSEEFSIELLQTTNNEEFNNNLIGTSLSSNLYTITELDNMPDGFGKDYLEVTIKSKTEATVKPASDWSELEIERDFEFNLDFDDSIFENGVSVEYDAYMEVYLPVGNLSWNVFEEDEYDIPANHLEEESIYISGKDDFETYLGLIYYELEDDENVYYFYRSSGFSYRFEALCYPDSREVMLLGYGETGEAGTYKTMDGGGADLDLISTEEVHIPESALAEYTGQEVYVLFRSWVNCKPYYGSLKVLVKDGSIEIQSVIFNNLAEEAVFTGQLITECLPDVQSTYHARIESVQIGTGAQPFDSSGYPDSAYVDYTGIKTFNISLDDPTLQLESAKTNEDTYWYAWIDYNRDDLFMANELVTYGTSVYDEDDEYHYISALHFNDDDPTGLYKIRIINSLHNDIGSTLNGCSDLKYGQVEDYMIYIQSYCFDEVVYTEPISSGTYSYDETITCQDDFYVGSQENVTLVAGEYVLLTPNSFVNYGSTFEAYIEACGMNAQKKEGETFVAEKSVEMNIYPNPCSSEFKVAYTVEEETPVTLEIYNSTGRVVQTVMTKEMHTAGSYTQSIDGSGLADGIYVVKIITQDKHISQKLIKIQ